MEFDIDDVLESVQYSSFLDMYEKFKNAHPDFSDFLIYQCYGNKENELTYCMLTKPFDNKKIVEREFSGYSFFNIISESDGFIVKISYGKESYGFYDDGNFLSRWYKLRYPNVPDFNRKIDFEITDMFGEMGEKDIKLIKIFIEDNDSESIREEVYGSEIEDPLDVPTEEIMKIVDAKQFEKMTSEIEEYSTERIHVENLLDKISKAGFPGYSFGRLIIGNQHVNAYSEPEKDFFIDDTPPAKKTENPPEPGHSGWSGMIPLDQ